MSALLSFLIATAFAAPLGPTPAADMASREIVLSTHAEGAQIYECRAEQGGGSLAWSFREPIASLIVADKTIGRHYAGPSWALDDGSIIKGKVILSAPGASEADIPSLKLRVVDHSGIGALGSVTAVYRVNTVGGALSGACPAAGRLRAVAYAADYVFTR